MARSGRKSGRKGGGGDVSDAPPKGGDGAPADAAKDTAPGHDGVAAAAAAAPPPPAAPAPASPADNVDPDDAVFMGRAHELKAEGNKLYEGRQYKDALTCYEQALKLTPPGHAERALYHTNRAACFLQLKQYLEVVRETTCALDVAPNSAKALLRRARAYEAIGESAKARKDAKVLVASAAEGDMQRAEAEELLTRLDNGAAKAAGKPAGAGPAGLGGMSLGGGGKKKQPKRTASDASKELAAPPAPPQPKLTTLRGKMSLGDDTRMVMLTDGMSLVQVLALAHKRFPEEKTQLELEFNGGKVTSDEELKAAFAAAVAATPEDARQQGAVVRFGITCAPPPPRAPAESESPFASLENENGELDEWVLDFAALFREHLGIDAEAHIELHSQGLDLCQDALDANTSTSKGMEMLDKAEGKFQEAAALAVLNWGNVHMCVARRKMDAAKAKGGEEVKNSEPPTKLDRKVAQEVENLLKLSNERFDRALEMKGDMHDAHIAKAQHQYERARLLCADNGTDKAKRDSEAEQVFVRADEMFQKVVKDLPEEEPKPSAAAAKEDGAADADGEAKDEAEDEPSMRAQVLVMWGNQLYEHSQFRARRGGEWQALLDRAVEKFNDAGCAQADVDSALAQHCGRKAQAGAA